MAADRQEFERSVRPHQAMLHRVCYRMLGSVDDADDVLQETLARAWENISQLQGAASMRSWLSRIAVNASIDHLRRKGRRELLEAEVEPVWLQPYPTGISLFGEPERTLQAREWMSLAYVVALQRLPAKQRAVLLLRRVLELSADETAATLSTSVAAVNSALQRANAKVGESVEPIPPVSDAERDAVQRFIAAWESDDSDALIALLRDDVVLTMPPRQEIVRGAEAVAAFFSAFVGGTFKRMLSTAVELNGQPAFAGHLEAPDGSYPASGFVVPEAVGAKIARFTIFGPELYDRMGLPASRNL